MAEYAPIPFDHTYVLYDPADLVSVACVQLSLLPVYVMVFYTLWFLITREIQPVIMVGGHLIGEVANKVIKEIIRQPRPDFHKDFGANSGLTYGMPLAHSQFMGFLSVYTSLLLFYRVPRLLSRWKAAGSAVMLTVAGCVAFSRVYLLYHTVQQVVVGVSLGLVLGCSYFVASELARDLGLVDWVLLWAIVRFFYIRDSYYHRYRTFAEEYAEYEAMRKKVE